MDELLRLFSAISLCPIADLSLFPDSVVTFLRHHGYIRKRPDGLFQVQQPIAPKRCADAYQEFMGAGNPGEKKLYPLDFPERWRSTTEELERVPGAFYGCRLTVHPSLNVHVDGRGRVAHRADKGPGGTLHVVGGASPFSVHVLREDRAGLAVHSITTSRSWLDLES